MTSAYIFNDVLFQINLEEQLEYFKTFAKQLQQKLGHEEAESLLHRSVFLFSIGGNDYVIYNMIRDPSLSEQVKHVGQVLGNLTAALEVRCILTLCYV